MAVAEGSFKVCGLCSQLVDEGVKLTDELVGFLMIFLSVPGTKLPTKICTECYQGAMDSKKYKEKCLRTVNKLRNNPLTGNMILGRTAEDIRIMKSKYRVSPKPELTSSGKKYANSINFRTPVRKGKASSAELLGSGYEDIPLSQRSALRKKAMRQAAGKSDSRKVPSVILSPKDRKAAEEALQKNQIIRGKKRRVKTPARFEVSHEKPNYAKTEPKGAQKYKYEVVEIEDDEEIFPSVGPYQCEICQEIKDTKQQFVGHIKSLHKDMVDASVLRSLETDLKKRMNKEAAKTKGGKAVAAAASKQKKKKNKPKPRPRPKYTEDDDEEYMPSKKKRKLVPTGESPVKEEGPKKPDGPATCDICGTVIAYASRMHRHKETLKCRQAAYNKAQAALANGETPAPPDGGPPTAETAAVAAEEGTVGGAETSSTAEVLRQSTDGNSNDSEAGGTKSSAFDAKFKASIAKRYEAERGSEDGKPAVEEEREGGGEGQQELDGAERTDLEDTEMAIKQAMQESLASAEKELFTDPEPRQEETSYQPQDDDLSHMRRREEVESPQGREHSSYLDGADQINDQSEGSKDQLGEHSPAAYIDPNPQPDVEPGLNLAQSMDKQETFARDKVDEHKPGSSLPGAGFTKPWEEEEQEGRARVQAEDSTLDLSALQGAQQQEADSLESQMAALHGTQGGNTPWHAFQNAYYQH